MGVTGLWRLIEPSGKPVPVETLENKVLAVDISIWLHQVVKGYQDARGAPMPNAHLMGLFQRLCKLLYFRIKPVFVFDGGFPDLKRETIAKRQDTKNKYHSESERLKREIVLLLGKKTAIGSILGKNISPTKLTKTNSVQASSDDDIFKLPALPEREHESESESDEEQNSSGSVVDLHSVDIESNDFKNMPVKEKYDLLVELKETRKMNSWGKLHQLPKKSDNFSDFQMKRLLKRRKVQECLEETEKEMGGNCLSLNELESLLNEDGIDTTIDSLPTHRIASSDTTRFILIKDMKQALQNAKKQELRPETEAKNIDVKPSTSKDDTGIDNVPKNSSHDELDEDLKKAIQMSLECVNEPNTSIRKSSKSEDSMDSSFIYDSDYSDTEDDDDFVAPDMSSAKAYILQYSDFTHKVIDEIVGRRKSADKGKIKSNKINEILKELNEEKTIITDKVELSSSDEEAENKNVELIGDVNDIPVDLDGTAESQTNLNNAIEYSTSQSSVAVIENLSQDIITLDSSIDDVNLLAGEKLQQKDSDSSDDDFEEVVDKTENLKPVVELNLNMEHTPEDDIFADIFVTETDEINVKKDLTLEHTNLNSNITEPNKSNKIETLSNLNSNQQNKGKSKNTRLTVVNIDKETEVCRDTSRINNNIIYSDKNTVADVNKEATIVNKIPNETLSNDKLNAMAESLDIEGEQLLQEKAKLDRVSRNITEQMTKEVQELLQIFGIPYIVAPMEAEAQCAFLESVKLTDGTITDDSDIWLFGGHTVYKNFFNQKKHVLQFLSDRIEKSYNLNREQLVLLALLVGSDYTTGLTGVGPVTALEILASFPYNKKDLVADSHIRYSRLIGGLEEFKKWVKAGKCTDNTNLKKKLRNVDVADDFPSARVVQAYFEPNVEKSRENFTWGELDMTILRDYTKAKFGWSQSKLDEIVKPVIKRLLEGKTQKTLQDYFKRKIEFQPLEDQMSKRVKAAVQKMGSGNCDKDDETNKEKKISKRKVATGVESNTLNDSNIDTITGTVSKDKNSRIKPKQRKKVINKKVIAVIENEIPTSSNIEINIPKLDRYQEIIPQREKDREHVLQNKMKAIEIFRKTNIDRKRNKLKKRVNLPKEKAELSESDSD